MLPKIICILLLWCRIFKWKVKVAQSCPTLWDPMDYTVHGILQAQNTRVGSLSLLQGIFPTQGLNPGLLRCKWILYSWATREAWNFKLVFIFIPMIHFLVNFIYDTCKMKVFSFLFFCTCMSNISSIICWKDSPFSTELPLNLCWKSFVHIYVSKPLKPSRA